MLNFRRFVTEKLNSPGVTTLIIPSPPHFAPGNNVQTFPPQQLPTAARSAETPDSIAFERSTYPPEDDQQPDCGTRNLVSEVLAQGRPEAKENCKNLDAKLAHSPLIARDEQVRLMKAVTDENNAFSRLLESQTRLQKHQARVYDDSAINLIRRDLEVSQPTPLPEVVEIIASPPIDCFPRRAADLIRAIAGHIGVPEELVMVTLIGVMFVAARGNFQIRVKDGYSEVLTGYLVAASPSGQRKSAVISYFRSIFEEIEGQRRSEQTRDGQDTVNFLTAKAVKIKKEKLAKKFGEWVEKGGIDLASEELKSEIAALEEIEKSVRMAKRKPRFLADLATPEALAEDLERQGEAMGMLTAEGGFWKRLHSRTDDLVLRAYTGEPYSIRTKTEGSVFLQAPVMAICTLVQPEVLTELFSNPELVGHGLVARVLPAFIAPRRGRDIGTGCEIPTELHGWLQCQVRDLLTLVRPDSEEHPRAFHLIDISQEGKAEIRRYSDEIKAQITAGHFDHCQAFADKLAGHAIRLAGAIHLMKHADPQQHLIDGDSIRAGTALAEYFRRHAEAAYRPEMREGVTFAPRILALIIQHRFAKFVLRDAQRLVHGARARQVMSGLDVLERHGYIRSHVREGRTEYVVHPHAHTYWRPHSLASLC